MPEEKLQTKGEQTRFTLIETACALFLQKGYHATSMRQIAEGAGLALGGIYNHFASKEEIFAAVLEAHHPMQRVLPRLSQVEGDTVADFVLDASRQIQKEIEGEEDKLVPLALVELVEFQGRHLGVLIERHFSTMMNFIEQFGRRRGKLRPVALPIMLRMFIVTVVGYMITQMVLSRVPAFKALNLSWYEGMIDIYLHGIVEREA